MDSQPPKPSVVISNNEINRNVFIAGIVFTVLIGSVIGFLLNDFITQKNFKNLPIAQDALANPIFTQWTAAVDGTLMKKNGTTFTLSNRGGELTISIHNTLTGFVALPASGSGTLQQYNINDIPLGSQLRGSVTIFPQTSGGLTNKTGEHIVGNAFTIEKFAGKQ